MTNIEPPVRKLFSQIEVVHSSAGRSDDGGPLRRVAVCAVIENPYAGQGYVEDLSALIGVSDAIGTLLGEEAARLLGEPVESYGKAGLVGTDGEQEHVNATAHLGVRRRVPQSHRWRGCLDHLGHQARHARSPHRRPAGLQGRDLGPEPLRRPRGAHP